MTGSQDSAVGSETTQDESAGDATVGSTAREQSADATVTVDGESFLLDVMLGKLAVYLRMCGHDAAYAQDIGVEADDELRRLAHREDRTLLTRDRELADRTDGARLLAGTTVEDRLRELHAAGVELRLADRPARCGNCNGAVVGPNPGDPRPDYVPDDVRAWRCVDCDQWFWKGSHWQRVEGTLRTVRRSK